jgi:carbon starvation protein
MLRGGRIWIPTLLWILIGTIFIGGVHDMGSLVASIRHKAAGIADTMREYVSKQVWILFNIFIFFSLVMVIVAFTDITTSSFVNTVELSGGRSIGGGATATSSILYLILPVIMGFLLKFTKLKLSWATLIFLPLVGIAIWIGQYIPFDLQAVMGLHSPQDAQKIWNIIILVYCFIAGIVPVWALLQPRGHLGGYFLYATLIVSFLGILFGGFPTKYPAFTNAIGSESFWKPMFPMLFITVACGACSGFHSLVSSGTTSKQLAKESDAKPVCYGMMLAESMVALIALATVMILPKGDALLSKSPNFIYANGLGSFMELIGVNKAFGISFGLMAFTTFVYDTLDVCTRLGRFIFQELTHLHGWFGRILSTLCIGGIPLILMSINLTDPDGKPVAIWSLFWKTFGASNQLLAALALIGITVWLQRTSSNKKAWLVTLIPAIFMFVMSVWALTNTFTSYTFANGSFAVPVGTNVIVPILCLIYIILAFWVAFASIPALLQNGKHSGRQNTGTAAA